MREEEKVLKIVYNLVKGDTSPVHLPVSPVSISQVSNLPVDRVQAVCKVLENHGYLISSQASAEPLYYYITKLGIAEALNPKVTQYFKHTIPSNRKRA